MDSGKFQTVIALMMTAAVAGCHQSTSANKPVPAKWIADQVGMSLNDKLSLSALVKSRSEQSQMLLQISNWRGCADRYGDGASQADSDFDRSTGTLFYAGSGGNSYSETVPGFADCVVPAHDHNKNPTGFKLLDQYGAEVEDSMVDVEPRRQCREKAFRFAETYNKEIALLDPHHLSVCDGRPSQRRKVSIAIKALQ